MTWKTKYFSLPEVTVSDTAARRGISNQPAPDISTRLRASAEKLDEVREMLGKPVLVTSGYRSPDLNKIIGGSNTSHHTLGYAFDFTSPGFGTPLEVARAIQKSGIKYDQLIQEFGDWVHISFAPSMRQQNLTARRKSGRTVYETGING